MYDEGAVTSIVVDAGPHGTHVAGITAAYHPEHTSLNGACMWVWVRVWVGVGGCFMRVVFCDKGRMLWSAAITHLSMQGIRVGIGYWGASDLSSVQI